MKVISVLSGSGGSAKTTLTAQIGFVMAQIGKKVLLVDLDPQANLKIYAGKPQDDIQVRSAADIFNNNTALPVGRDINNLLDVIWGDIILTDIQAKIANQRRREYLLADYVQKNLSEYDVILLDCPATLGLFCENAVVASTNILIPLVPTDKSLQNMVLLNRWLYTIIEDCKLEPAPKIIGIIPSIFDKDSATHRNCLDALKLNAKKLAIDLLATVPKWLEIENSCGRGIPLAIHKPSHPGIEVLNKLTNQILQKLES